MYTYLYVFIHTDRHAYLFICMCLSIYLSIYLYVSFGVLFGSSTGFFKRFMLASTVYMRFTGAKPVEAAQTGRHSDRG